MKTKICSKCKRELSEDCFSKKKNSKDGLQYVCKECKSKYSKIHYCDNKGVYIKRALKTNKDKREWWQEYKKQFKCVLCGEDDECCIDFHHVNSEEKEKEVSQMIVLRSKEKIIEEIEKCIPVCSNCHRKIHAGKIVV